MQTGEIDRKVGGNGHGDVVGEKGEMGNGMKSDVVGLMKFYRLEI